MTPSLHTQSLQIIDEVLKYPDTSEVIYFLMKYTFRDHVETEI
jgi:hypothetical protein